jgi:hypothetical protein
MAPTIEWNYGDVGQHSATIGSSAASLAAVHQSILSDVEACKEFWQSKGATAYDDFVRELNRNFQVVFESLEDHGKKVGQTLGNTQSLDQNIGSSWA